MRNRWNRTLFFLIFFALVVALTGAQTEEKRNFPRFNFNVGGGEGIGRGDAGAFSGNSFFAVGGAGWNFNKIFGVSAEYMYYDLPIRPSVALAQKLGSANASLNAISLNGIIRIPYKLGRYGAYGILGVGFYDRNSYSNAGLVSARRTCGSLPGGGGIFIVRGSQPVATCPLLHPNRSAPTRRLRAATILAGASPST